MNLITKDDPFKEDELMNWNCIRFLNRLQYEKDKNRTEILERRAHAKNI